ncbi:MAG: DUF6056 family protein [Promicromonosporaceae bacterium]|nr:DUF6056 family protein [Promicromonosporaceae bacterium]
MVNKYQAFIWVAFGVFLLYSMSFVFMYADDFGYASLKYVYELPGVQGHDFTFAQLSRFLRGIYFNWSGRVIFPGLKILMLVNNIWIIRIAQSLSVLIVFCFLAILPLRGLKRNLATTAFTISLYGAFAFEMYRGGFLWFSASISFVVPLVFFFLAWFLVQRIREDLTNSTFQVIVCCASLFLAAVSAEQTAITAAVLIAGLAVHDLARNRRFQRRMLWCVASVVSGSAFLILAPGNYARFTVQEHLATESAFHRAIANFYSMAATILDIRGNGVFLVAFASFICYLAYRVIVSKIGFFQIGYAAFPLTALMLAFSVNPIPWDIGPVTLLSFTIFSLTACAVILLYFTQISPEKYLLYVFIGGLLSQLTFLFLAPVFEARMMIIFYFSIFTLFIRAFGEVQSSLPQTSQVLYVLTPVLIFSMFNLAGLTRGYRLNAPSYSGNDQILRAAAAQIAAGEDPGLIVLSTPVDWRYSSDIPFHPHFRRYFYNIPLQFPIIHPTVEDRLALDSPFRITEPPLADQVSVETDGNSVWWWLEPSDLAFRVLSSDGFYSISFWIMAAECSNQTFEFSLESGDAIVSEMVNLSASDGRLVTLSLDSDVIRAEWRIHHVDGGACTTPYDGRPRVALLVDPAIHD